MKRLLLTVMAAAALCAGCAKTEITGAKLVIVHLNDTHSHLDPLAAGELTGRCGVIERAAFIDSVRAANGADKVLVLHAGDFNQGSSYYSEFKGALEVELAVALGYDAIALGNHEFDNGIEDLAERVKKLDCPVLCANYSFAGLPLDTLVKPCTVLERGGMKVGVIGMESNLAEMVSSKTSSRLKALDNVGVVNEWAKDLRENKGCELVVLLSHMGMSEDLRVIPQTSGVDLVIGGHSHTDIDEPIVVKDADGKDIPVVTVGCWGKKMGVITLR